MASVATKSQQLQVKVIKGMDFNEIFRLQISRTFFKEQKRKQTLFLLALSSDVITGFKLCKENELSH